MSALHAPIYSSRLRELVRLITPHFRPGDTVLDVGCGGGTLGEALLKSPGCPAEVRIRGLERFPRGGEPIEVIPYDGLTMPVPDASQDIVIVADVLHHDEDPERLLRECRRVCRRLLVIKDHQRRGLLAQARLSFIDWAANAPYGVRCLYRYNTPAQWRAVPGRLGLSVVEEHASMNLYPPFVNLLFGRSLQYMAFLGIPEAHASDAAASGTR